MAKSAIFLQKLCFFSQKGAFFSRVYFAQTCWEDCYYNGCYTIEGCGHLYYKVDTKIETIKLHTQGPKQDRTLF